jgi:ATP-dependent helicase HepA
MRSPPWLATHVSPSLLYVGMLIEAACGFGRLLELEGNNALVEYFDRPGKGGLERRIEDARRLQRAVLAPQTRVHWRRDGLWDHGRVIEHDRTESRVVVRCVGGREGIIPESDVVVRWRQRLRNASALLADGWIESRRFHDARHAFVRAYLAREADYRGLTAISSAAIEAHPHQLEAVRRVLTDVQPRYLLADEVGLGKTIEAGLLIRQLLLDRRDTRALVIVPEALTYQWRDELDVKFAISEQFPGRCVVVSHDEFGQLAESRPELLVVDEAHRLTKEDDSAYRRVRDAALQAPGVLLLSATPLLQEPASLLRMLHLLSPEVHPLEDIEPFEQALASREELAALYGNLNETAAPVFLASAVAGLRTALADDARLLELLDCVDAASATGDPDAIATAVRRARLHVAEVHRLHDRMIRTRRGVGLAEDFPVLGRIPPRIERVPNALVEVVEAFVVWHEYILARADGADHEMRSRIVAEALPIVAMLSSGGSGLVDAVDGRLSQDNSVREPEESELLADLAEAARRRAASCPRMARTIAVAKAAAAKGERVAVAASTERLAARLEDALCQALGRPILRITPEAPEAARRFAEAEAGAILVFGPVGEEGQNLQAATIVVHVDLPWDANRLEQRLGRFDRFGAGVPCGHVVLIDDDDSPANAWHDLLREGFGIFSGSIASLQLAIERLGPRIDEAAVLRGPDAMRDIAPWVASELEQELAAVELTELLDETVLDDRGREFVDAVEVADSRGRAASWEESVVLWASGGPDETADLRFHHSVDNERHEFCLTRYANPDVQRLRDTDLPLVAWADLLDRFSGSMPDARACGTFRRNSAAYRGLRLFGPGDPFIDALWDFTEIDDRGRAYALWRARPFWKRDETLFVCFDLRVRPDVDAAIDATGREPRSVEASMRRRAESYLAPITERVWLMIDGRAVVHAGLLKLLEAPYADRRGDQTLRPAMWDRLDVYVPRASWGAWCAEQERRALAVVTERKDLTARCGFAAEQAAEDSADQVARLLARGGASAASSANVEAQVGAALVAGLESPRFEVDAVGIVVLASTPIPQEPDE